MQLSFGLFYFSQDRFLLPAPVLPHSESPSRDGLVDAQSKLVNVGDPPPNASKADTIENPSRHSAGSFGISLPAASSCSVTILTAAPLSFSEANALQRAASCSQC